MEPAHIPAFPEPFIAAMPQLNGKPCLGVPSTNPAPNPGLNDCNSTTAIGLRAGLHLERVRSRCTGKERDAESGNDYFGARYYASTMGRFMSPDWSAKVEPVPYAKLDNPQSLNLYAYVFNNPLSHTDADGHACDWCKDTWEKYNNFNAGKGAYTNAQLNAMNQAMQPKKFSPVAPSASLHTDMSGHSTTFTSTNIFGQTKTVEIETRNDVSSKAAPGAGDAFSVPNIGRVGNPNGASDEMGPKDAYIETEPGAGSRRRQLHGGGTGSPDPQGPNQGKWVPTLGCTRGMNAGVISQGQEIKDTRSDPYEYGAIIPYSRN